MIGVDCVHARVCTDYPRKCNDCWKDLDIWIIRMWREGEFKDELVNYPNYVAWVASNRLFKDKKWSSGHFEEGYRGYIDTIDGYMCLVVYKSYKYKYGMRAPTDDEVKEAINNGKVIDWTPNEQRLNEYEIYSWWLEKYHSKLGAIREVLDDLDKEVKEVI